MDPLQTISPRSRATSRILCFRDRSESCGIFYSPLRQINRENLSSLLPRAQRYDDDEAIYDACTVPELDEQVNTIGRMKAQSGGGSV